MKGFLFAILCLLAATPASAKRKIENGMELLVGMDYVSESSSFTATNGSEATFKGSQTGGHLVLKFVTPSDYGLGLLFGGASRKADNNANGTGITESLSGSSIDIGLRFYAMDLFLGAKLNYSPLSVRYSDSSTTTTTNYKSIGAGFSLGMDLFLGNSLHFTPKVEITTGSALPESGSASSKRFTNYGLGIGVGLAF